MIILALQLSAEAAMAHWEQYTPIIFVPRTTQSNLLNSRMEMAAPRMLE
jgi:hypothetical protein